MKNHILRILAMSGVSIGRSVEKNRLRDLVNRLHPVTTANALIRIGGDGDGGYLVPDDLAGVVACFSPGVGSITSFDEHLAARGIPCFLADASVEKPPISNPLIRFKKKFLGVVDDDTTTTLDEWLKQCAPAQGDLLLQMDIEGSEWPVLLNASDDALSRFRIMVLELHSLERLIDKFSFQIMYAAFDRLLRKFAVVHLHPNNVERAVDVGGLLIPRYLEVTLVRRDRIHSTGYATQFPHPLDRKNVAGKPDLVLPADWHRTVG
jgi:Methyltransferase FkbM domain